MRFALLTLCVLLLPVACGPGLPDLEQELSAEARAADYPQLVPLDPLLARADAPLRRSAAVEGSSLEARAADLRRRAAWLRAMAL
ncbi:hypothetical protein [Gymnodinialimonas ceratoperidinii]|uniref:Uncharacterized protein n=1 Tax=Gymnodinialimonas ceratoperidinii TaxID=2856823 RepID=A0A8F6TYZ5_9RHOB|nr:hypothetical protein [Gymnodinialimonas ceratoperidinii]QXT41038.1 hypothetical protein KYE46_07435 [Gymnodinialimonas ceratoperidinii]